MKKYLLALTSTMALPFFSPVTQASILSIDAGSNWCATLAPGFVTCYSMVNNAGIRIGEIQPASGSHTGLPDGSESPGIDQPWEFFGNTGMHLTTSPVTILSHDANTMLLDFSGWAMTWNGIDVMPLGTGSWYPNLDGVAEVSCAIDCQDGDSYTLLYTAIMPQGDSSGFGGVPYSLHLTGTISAVPLPAAIWLFLSGLAGLTAIVRKQTIIKRNLV